MDGLFSHAMHLPFEELDKSKGKGNNSEILKLGFILGRCSFNLV